MTDGARTVLDASALLAWMHDEAGAEVIDPFIGPGSVVCAVNWGEVLYKLAEVGAGEEEANGVLQLGVEVVPFEIEHATLLPRWKQLDVKARAAWKQAHGGEKRLSMADMCCLAVAAASDLMVVTGDSYWAALGSGLEIVDYRVGSSA